MSMLMAVLYLQLSKCKWRAEGHIRLLLTMISQIFQDRKTDVCGRINICTSTFMNTFAMWICGLIHVCIFPGGMWFINEKLHTFLHTHSFINLIILGTSHCWILCACIFFSMDPMHTNITKTSLWYSDKWFSTSVLLTECNFEWDLVI